MIIKENSEERKDVECMDDRDAINILANPHIEYNSENCDKKVNFIKDKTILTDNSYSKACSLNDTLIKIKELADTAYKQVDAFYDSIEEGFPANYDAHTIEPILQSLVGNAFPTIRAIKNMVCGMQVGFIKTCFAARKTSKENL